MAGEEFHSFLCERQSDELIPVEFEEGPVTWVDEIQLTGPFSLAAEKIHRALVSGGASYTLKRVESALLRLLEKKVARLIEKAPQLFLLGELPTMALQEELDYATTPKATESDATQGTAGNSFETPGNRNLPDSKDLTGQPPRIPNLPAEPIAF